MEVVVWRWGGVAPGLRGLDTAAAQDSHTRPHRAPRTPVPSALQRVNLGAPGVSCTEFCRRNKCGKANAIGSCKAATADVCSVVPAKPAL